MLCGICGENHCPMECDIIQVVSHVPDKTIPSKAQLTVPEDFELRKMADNTYNIVAMCSFEKGTQFGPLQAKKGCSLLPAITFPLRLFNKNEEEILSEYYLDTSDENECNWMMFVSPACDFQEQNTICYQDGEDIYYVTVKDICEGEALKVWYSPYYATKMQKDVLKAVNDDENQNVQDNNYMDTLVRNKKNITSREVWSCKFCGKMEKNLSEFALHLLQHYRQTLKRYCQICNSYFLKMKDYKGHMKIVHETDVISHSNVQLEEKSSLLQKSDKNYSDSLPKDTYFGGPLLLNELLSDSMDNTGLVLPSHTDNQMDLTGIGNQNNLFENENLNLNMESILTENVKDLDNFNFELAPTEPEQFVCDICLKTFKNLKAMVIHMDIHTGRYTCFDCYKVFARKENLEHHACKTFYKIKCPFCNRLFTQQKYFNLHLKIDHNYNCKKCKIFFESKEQLDDHKCSKTTSEIRYTCSDCSKVFSHKNNLIIHAKRHQTSKEYNCPICNNLFSSYKTYSKHRKIHDGRNYKCDICDKIFKRQDSVKTHKEAVHVESAKNMKVCEICKKHCKSQKLLKLHMEIHEKNMFKCQQCSASFKQQKNLKRHIRTKHKVKVSSDADKQFSCPKCDKKMKLSTSVLRHLRVIHRDKTDYKVIKIQKTEHKKRTRLSKQVEDLKQTIENMNFNTDEINHEITTEIDKLLNNPETFASDSNDRLVESLINTAVSENNLGAKTDQKDPMLSMPDLDMDQNVG